MKRSHIELFETLASEPDGGPVEKGLMVMSTPRSGSTLFCDVLTNSGLIGVCDEWFNEEFFCVWQKVLGKLSFDLKEYLKWVSRKTVKDTGVFALHVHIGQLLHISTTYEFSVGDMAFDHIVWVYREDKIAQAVSLAKAIKTNQWKSSEEVKKSEPITYGMIVEALLTLVSNDDFYRGVMSCHTDTEYAYEQFETLPCGPNSPWNRVMSELGKPEIGTPIPSTTKQRTFETRQLAREFLNYLSGE
jgi:LPS sulfotransferase NodH